MSWMTGFEFLLVQDVSRLYNIQTGYGYHSASYTVGTQIIPHRKSGQGVKLTSHLHVVLRLTHGVMLQFPHRTEGHGVCLIKNCTLYQSCMRHDFGFCNCCIFRYFPNVVQ
jgi:hypothetical protein